MITFVTFFWRGWRPVYSAQHVNTWALMVNRNCSLPHRVLCITDNASGIDCETAPLLPVPAVRQDRPQNCYARLRLFDPEYCATLNIAHMSRVVCMDLDAVVLRDLAPLFTDRYSFAAVRGVSAPINGSMWALTTSTNAHVWRQFIENPQAAVDRISATRHGKKRLVGSDQAWMSMNITAPRTWGPEAGVYQYSLLQHGDEARARVVFFSGHEKPWYSGCADKHPALFSEYRRHTLGAQIQAGHREA